ncbi:MAG: hypothetical protein U0168_18150 [Nannocystaceae bacterium]
MRTSSSAETSASIEGQRAWGSGASPRSSARRNHGGVRADRGHSRRRPWVTAAASAGSESPANGRSPQMASQVETQNEN